MTREIPLTHGRVVLVDDADFGTLSAFHWHAIGGRGGKPYVVRREVIDGRQRTILMHRELLRPPAGVLVDHIDGSGLNNQRGNLRLATNQQNMCNRLRAYSASGYRGVSSLRGMWAAHVTAHGRQHHVGLFATAEEAARARDLKAIELHGQFVALNFPASLDRAAVDPDALDLFEGRQ